MELHVYRVFFTLYGERMHKDYVTDCFVSASNLAFKEFGKKVSFEDYDELDIKDRGAIKTTDLVNA